jgi:hypothetical protein
MSENNINIYHNETEIGCIYEDWIQLAQDMFQRQIFVSMAMKFGSHKSWD